MRNMNHLSIYSCFKLAVVTHSQPIRFDTSLRDLDLYLRSQHCQQARTFMFFFSLGKLPIDLDTVWCAADVCWVDQEYSSLGLDD